MAKHPYKALSALKVKNIKLPGRYTDGKGLHLYVDKNLRKRWVLRISVKGAKRIDMGLGGYPDVSLEEARSETKKYRHVAREGINPVTAKKAALAAQITFEECARKVHQSHAPSWKNPKHADQWIHTMEAYVFPVFGDLAISQITSANILDALGAIWLEKQETARRVKQRIRMVIDWAKASELYSGDNPVDVITKALPKQNDKPVHHSALPYQQLPDFLSEVWADDASEVVKACLEFTILTAARTGEVLNATWDEIDLVSAEWTIPATRIKSNRIHRVPLSNRCVEILHFAYELHTSQFIFPGHHPEKPLSNMTMLKLVKRIDPTLTVHGFRSSFRDWAAECTNFPRDVVEAALAHSLADKTEAAYKRTDLFDKRRKLMNLWTTYLSATSKADVILLRRNE